MEQQGLLSWANSIRLTMATDPGRLVFKEQVQTHGFMFLDDYLENIVSGAKADPLIELVKTPGRKRAIARKPKLMSSKLTNNIFSLPEEPSGAENASPSGSSNVVSEKMELEGSMVQKAKRSLDLPSSDNHSSARSPLVPVQPTSNEETRSAAEETGPSPAPSSSAPSVPDALPPQPSAAQPAIKLAIRPSKDHNDLSIIAEDDESAERSRQSSSGLQQTQLPPPPSPPAAANTASSSSKPRLSELMQDVIHTGEQTKSARSSSSSMHSIALDGDQAVPPHHNAKDDAPTSQPAETDIFQDPSPGVDDQDVAMSDATTADAPPLDNTTKSAATLFPTLPEPMAIVKPRGPSLNPVMLGSATPGAGLGGKRPSSSWLMKTRERKALEVPIKKSSSSTAALAGEHGPSSMAQSTKRKSGDTANEDDERQSKVHKTLEGSSAPLNSMDILVPVKDPAPENVSQQGVYDLLKKTVEGFGARSGKPLNKSLGGTALAEAKAAAEAKIAERDRKEEEMTMAVGAPSAPASKSGTDAGTFSRKDRLSLSDLFPLEGKVKEKDRVREKPFQFTPSFTPTRNKEKEREVFKAHERTSTTPAHSPPPHTKSKLSAQHTVPSHKPSSVFAPPPPAPVPAPTKAPVFEPPPVVFKPPTVNKPVPSTSSHSIFTAPLTAQSTIETVQDDLFDDTIPPWQPSTQDTDYTSAYDTQSQPATQICDEDDSWPMDEKLAAGVQWTYGEAKEDSMTWSTLPSQSQRADTGPLTSKSTESNRVPRQEEPAQPSREIPGAFSADNDDAMQEDKEEPSKDPELENAILATKMATPAPEPKIPRSQSQLSMASSSSSQSQGGFLTQASKLLSSALGTNKKKQPEVKKVLQMAASAAKKQQEEADKKAQRLKEMETRRQQALQRKAEEEKTKSLAEERKLKEEAERRKRERDDQTDKRAIKPPGSKKEEDTQKKRKIESEKKPELKKQASGILSNKPQMKSALKQPSAHTFGSQSAVAESSTSNSKGKNAATPQQSAMHEDEVSQPSHLLQSQMAARAKAKLEAARQTEPLVPSESIELPDINSEYSDSEDEDRVKTFDPPDWAQSPELRQALEMQSTVNPDDIFGPVRPLRMEEIFKTRTSRFRARSSSANWTGTDRLTMQEETEYARRMGFK